jgi:hypothetical protein
VGDKIIPDFFESHGGKPRVADITVRAPGLFKGGRKTGQKQE